MRSPADGEHRQLAALPSPKLSAFTQHTHAAGLSRCSAAVPEPGSESKWRDGTTTEPSYNKREKITLQAYMPPSSQHDRTQKDRPPYLPALQTSAPIGTSSTAPASSTAAGKKWCTQMRAPSRPQERQQPQPWVQQQPQRQAQRVLEEVGLELLQRWAQLHLQHSDMHAAGFRMMARTQRAISRHQCPRCCTPSIHPPPRPAPPGAPALPGGAGGAPSSSEAMSFV